MAGYVTGIRFYKGAGNTGTHVGHLWSATGQLLATATFTSETATGWQQVSFAAPVAIAANTTYVASYFAPAGHYALDRPYFTTGYDNAPLHALADGGRRRQRRLRASAGGFPTESYHGEQLLGRRRVRTHAATRHDAADGDQRSAGLGSDRA